MHTAAQADNGLRKNRKNKTDNDDDDGDDDDEKNPQTRFSWFPCVFFFFFILCLFYCLNVGLSCHFELKKKKRRTTTTKRRGPLDCVRIIITIVSHLSGDDDAGNGSGANNTTYREQWTRIHTWNCIAHVANEYVFGTSFTRKSVYSNFLHINTDPHIHTCMLRAQPLSVCASFTSFRWLFLVSHFFLPSRFVCETLSTVIIRVNATRREK